MNPRYKPKTVLATLGWLTEECGEVQAAVGKTIRWGVESFNPELPPDERETNRAWILRELHDLKLAIMHTEAALDGNMIDLIERIRVERVDRIAEDNNAF